MIAQGYFLEAISRLLFRKGNSPRAQSFWWEEDMEIRVQEYRSGYNLQGCIIGDIHWEIYRDLKKGPLDLD